MELALSHTNLPRGIYDWCLLFFFNGWESLAVWLLDLLRGFKSSYATRSVAILSLLFPLEQEWVSSLCTGARRREKTLPFLCSITKKWVAAWWSRHLFGCGWNFRFPLLSLHVTTRTLTTFSILGRPYSEVWWLPPWGCEGSNSPLRSILGHHCREGSSRRRYLLLLRGFFGVLGLFDINLLLICWRLLTTITSHFIEFKFY